MNYQTLTKEILKNVGGVENIANMTHCATRLRLTLKDPTQANDAEIKKIPGVINLIHKAGQYQILIGTEVPKLYDEFEDIVKGRNDSSNAITSTASGNIVSVVFSAISAIFAPLLPALAGSGILRGLLILAVQVGLIREDSGTYTLLFVASMSVFYFLPVLLAFTSARRFGASPYLSALIGASLLHPEFIALIGPMG